MGRSKVSPQDAPNMTRKHLAQKQIFMVNPNISYFKVLCLLKDERLFTVQLAESG